MSKSPSIDLISPKQIKVYDLLSRNCYPRLIADKLDISINCVYKHIENPQTRNNLFNPVAVYRMGIEEGYFPRVPVFRQCIGYNRSNGSKIFMPVYACPCCGRT